MRPYFSTAETVSPGLKRKFPVSENRRRDELLMESGFNSIAWASGLYNYAVIAMGGVARWIGQSDRNG